MNETELEKIMTLLTKQNKLINFYHEEALTGHVIRFTDEKAEEEMDKIVKRINEMFNEIITGTKNGKL